jgi:hypothetical protein
VEPAAQADKILLNGCGGVQNIAHVNVLLSCTANQYNRKTPAGKHRRQRKKAETPVENLRKILAPLQRVCYTVYV